MADTIDAVATDPTADDEILRPDGTAAYLKLSLPTVMDLIHSGELKAARVGRQWRVRRSWIHEYLDRQAVSA
jgi:excisionase family DNA binding protein